jgi:ankyrin repeat protein
MNLLRVASWTAIASLLFWSCDAVASVASVNDCAVRAEPQRASWIAWLERHLKQYDSAHAAQLTKAAAVIIEGDTGALKSDLDSGLDPNAVLRLGPNDASDMALLTLAAAACQRSAADQLLTSGASPNGVGDSTPIVAAAGSGATSVAKSLILHGASVGKVDANGHTALEDAVRQRHLGAVRFLLANGADPDHLVSGGRGTVLDLVAHSSAPVDQSIARALRAHGAGAALPSGH